MKVNNSAKGPDIVHVVVVLVVVVLVSVKAEPLFRSGGRWRQSIICHLSRNINGSILLWPNQTRPTHDDAKS